jgi:hypothetical protein
MCNKVAGKARIATNKEQRRQETLKVKGAAAT